ncbi:MAG: SH3 domain-containing protein [Deltaproteobacteria bacterium]|nr:SH3 domain-containing protein [Deltaproteobacteria bacterium]
MRLRGNFGSALLVTLLLVLAGACATPPPPTPGGTFYLSPDMTYLRDGAGFENHVVGQLYKGEAVERLDIGESGWSRVRSGRTGQAGWVPSELLSVKPLPVAYVYVTQTVHLRECPKDFCPALQLLSRGDQVQKVEQNDQGWWRVLVAKSRNLGWLPAKALAEKLEQPQAKAPEPQYYFVVVRRLPLRREPKVDAGAVTLLQFNDQLEKLEQNPGGWLKVRQPSSGGIGWVQERFIGTTPLKFPHFEKPRKKKSPSPKPAEIGTPAEPEVM